MKNNLSQNFLDQIFDFELNLNTNNRDISPVVDTTRVNAILTTNRIDKPVEDFAQNGAIMNSITEPHSAVYLTQAIRLEQQYIDQIDVLRQSSNADISFYIKYSEKMVR